MACPVCNRPLAVFDCRSCRPRPLRTCGVCGNGRRTKTIWPLGPVCSGCYQTLRATPANLHPLINNQTANTTGRVSNHWISAAMRGQDATLERLRVDRQLEEVMVKGPDPLHLAEVFGLDEKTAMRYADSARALLTGWPETQST